MTIRFSGQTVVVTGAGRGLGRACAHELARLGANVIVNDHGAQMDGTDPDPRIADAVAREIADAGGTAVASHEDISDQAAANRVIDLALDRFGRVDALAHYAAIFRHHRRFDELFAEDFEAVVHNNLVGSFYVTQRAFQHMKAQRYGRILLVGSAVGLFGVGFESNYGSSKGGLHGLMRCAAIEGREHGIRVNQLMPAARTRNSVQGPYMGDAEARKVRDALGCEYEPEHSAPFAAYLLSRENETSGQTFSSMLGCFSQVLIAATRGWQAQPKGGIPSIDDVAAHWGQIVDPTDALFPDSIREWGVHIKASYDRAG